MNILSIAKFRLSLAYKDFSYRKGVDYIKLNKLPKHVGEVGFLIGNGPSVRTEDLDRLCGRVSFCCNRFYMAYSTMSFRPTYTLSADRQVIEDWGEDIVNMSDGEVVLVSKSKPRIKKCIWVPDVSRRHLVFQKSRLSHVMTGGGTLFTAMQLGYFLGIRKFVLYGVDHNFNFDKAEGATDPYRSASGDENHFIKGYRSGKNWCPPEMEMVEYNFKYADQYLRQRGGFVKNATRGGKLEVLERISFDKAIELDAPDLVTNT